jgi:exodeoxyribonuclease-3
MPSPDRLSLLAWNILHGGGAKRAASIALRLLEIAPDVLVLSEFRTTMGGQLRALLAEHGWEHQLCTDPTTGRNGMLIASREPIRAASAAPAAFAGRFIHVTHLSTGVDIVGVHAPDGFDRSSRQAAYWHHLLDVAKPAATGPCVILGDFNTGRHRQDEAGESFQCTALLGQLCTYGYRDAWRQLHPQDQDFTWFSHQGGGFRIDAAYCSPPLLDALVSARHIHATRTAQESDHSALWVDFSRFSTLKSHVQEPDLCTDAENQGLFVVEKPRLPS